MFHMNAPTKNAAVKTRGSSTVCVNASYLVKLLNLINSPYVLWV
jgi:hypothetical protein